MEPSLFYPAQQKIVVAWFVIGAVLLGLGLLTRRFFGPPLRGPSDLWPSFWTGFAMLLSVLQIWHCFAPIDDRTRVFVAVLAGGGWLAGGLAPWRGLARSMLRNAVAIVAIVACGFWMSNQSLMGPRFGDTGMYLVPSMLWVERYAIVPGLANLFVPLGNNISYFLYGALLDAGPFTERVYHIINSVFALALLGRGLVGLWRLLLRDGRWSAADVFYAVMLVPVLREMVFTLYLTSPMPDTLVFFLGVVLAGELVELATAPLGSPRTSLPLFAFLGAAGITIKLSLAGPALALAAIAALIWLLRVRPTAAAAFRTLAVALLVALLPAGVWVVRSAILSGYPFYPAQIFGLPVDWIARVDATAWVQRPMQLAPLWSVFQDPAWWRQRMLSLGWMEDEAMRLYWMLGITFVVFLLLRPLSWWKGHPQRVTLLILVPPIAAGIFNFLNTPMVRYQGAMLWVLAANFVVLALAGFHGRPGRALRLLCVVAVIAACTLPFRSAEEPWLKLRDFQGTSGPRIHEETLPSGLVVRVPESQVCWDAELPCTPEPHPGLELRQPGDMSKGFRIDPTRVPAEDKPPS